MTVEFISLSFTNPSNELNPIPGAQIDRDYFIRYARAVEDGGFNYTLQPYGSGSFDPFITATTLTQYTERVKPIVALRPNNIHPTYAAKTLATLDQVSGGRAAVHLIAGGSDADQAREGDFLQKDARYDREAEYIGILRRAWGSEDPVDFEGEHYCVRDFRNGVRPVSDIPISVGGSSEAAYRVGASLADIFGLWGEPLKETQEQIERVSAQAASAGRSGRPRIWVTFRPIIAPTEELAWEKARRHLSAVEANEAAGLSSRTGKHHNGKGRAPQNVGSQRLLDIAARGEVHDRALWTAPAMATKAAGASTALVGTPETVAAAILDYVDLGAELISVRGYDTLNDVIDYGRYLLPLVHQELAHRAATGRRDEVVAQHPLPEVPQRAVAI